MCVPGALAPPRTAAAQGLRRLAGQNRESVVVFMPRLLKVLPS